MNTNILTGKEARTKVIEGINMVANAVKVTLGHSGRNVIINNGKVTTTKDGVTVAREIVLKDEGLNAGAKIIKEIAGKVADEAGDGTTTVCVLLQAMIEEGDKRLHDSSNPVEFKKGIELAVDCITKTLDQNKIEVAGNKELLKQVAAVSANNDKEIGDLVGNIIEELGVYGVIDIESTPSMETKVERVNGFQIKNGYYHEYFVTDALRNVSELKTPYIFLVEGKLTDKVGFGTIMNKVLKESGSLAVIAQDFDNEIAGLAIKNQARLPINFIRHGLSGDYRTEYLNDLAAVTGAKVYSEESGKRMENVGLDFLGQCEHLESTLDTTTIRKGKENKTLVASRIVDAKSKLERLAHPVLRSLQEERIAKLTNGLAVCHVGGVTDIEIGQKKDRIEDSILATKSAMQEGVVAGGGLALIQCLSELKKIQTSSPDEQSGVNVVMEAIKKPAIQMHTNARAEDGGLMAYLMILDGGINNIGYNVATGEKEDLVAAGIIDPKKVVRLCVQSAASAAIQVLLSEALIYTDND